MEPSIYANYKPKANGTKKLFENPLLEKLTRTHISVPLIIFFSYAFALLYWSASHTQLSLLVSVLLFIGGIVFFTWVEYNVHRFIFHLPHYTPRHAKFQYTVHGVHHEYPKDKTRLAMPPVLSITISTLLFFLFRFVLGDVAYVCLAGFLVGYASYLWVHYMTHVYAPPKNFFKVFWVNHAVHHYLKEGYSYGVTSPFWDYVYGTMPDKEKWKMRVEENL